VVALIGFSIALVSLLMMKVKSDIDTMRHIKNCESMGPRYCGECKYATKCQEYYGSKGRA
jgi:hypothetical protein